MLATTTITSTPSTSITMEKPTAYTYESHLAPYSMAPAAVPPAMPTNLTPVTSPTELPSSSYYRRDSYISSAVTSPSGSSPTYTPPNYPAAIPEARGDYDEHSPLHGLPEANGVHVPPLHAPPVTAKDLEDWDNLPELLRQDRKADYSPRRPMNIYFIYMRMRRPELAAHNPNLSTGELSKLLGKEWNQMSTDQKAPWNDLAELLMRSFKRKFPDYQYERGGGKKANKKRTRSAPHMAAAHRMVEHSAAVAAARRTGHHHQMLPHHGHDAWGQHQYVYRTEEYPEYAHPGYSHPSYPVMSAPLSAGAVPPYPYGYEYAQNPNAAPLSAPLEANYMSQQQASYFPLSSPGFAPSAAPQTAPSSMMAPRQMGQEMGYYSQGPSQGSMYPQNAAPDASSPWEEYMN